jgi:hypothetical protein
LPGPLGVGEHPFRVDLAVGEQSQVAVVARRELDAGNVRQPVRWCAFELELDPPPLRAAPQRGELAGGDDAAVVDDRDLFADVLD